MSPTAQCLVVLLFTGVAAPIAGMLFRHVSSGWDSVGKGPFAIEQQLPSVPRYLARPAPAVDPAIQAAEVRQMLEAKASRQQRRGEAAIDVDAEATRLLAPVDEASSAGARQDAELRAEVRQLVLTRNERRMRKGLEPLDVEAETERQLADFIGSS
ncbi:MAG: hypothetical protein WA862_13410 [Solirubrobacterales bacterium]